MNQTPPDDHTEEDYLSYLITSHSEAVMVEKLKGNSGATIDVPTYEEWLNRKSKGE